MSGFFDYLNPSNWFDGDSGLNSVLDFLDPGNTFHTGASTRMANDQWEWQKDKYEENFEWQKKVYKNQLDLINVGMERENDAVQRRVNDLRAAGLSPTLAAGSAAQSAQAHVGSAPQYEVGSNPKLEMAMFKEQMQKERMALAMSLMGNIADVSKTKAETELLKQKGQYQDILNKYAEDTMKAKLAGLELSNAGRVIGNEAAQVALNYNREANPEKLKQLKLTTDTISKKLDILGFDSLIRENESLRQVYYNTKAEYESELAKENVNLAKLKAENIDFDTAIKAYTLKYAYDRKLPISGYNKAMMVKEIVSLVDKLFNGSGKGSIPAPGNRSDNWEDWQNEGMNGPLIPF